VSYAFPLSSWQKAANVPASVKIEGKRVRKLSDSIPPGLPFSNLSGANLERP
jgi:hypothetical protein